MCAGRFGCSKCRQLEKKLPLDPESENPESSISLRTSLRSMLAHIESETKSFEALGLVLSVPIDYDAI
jgi:hypothetical protein